MDELLNSIEIPNGIGFEIIQETFRKLFKDEVGFIKFKKEYFKKMNDLLISLGTDGILPIPFSFSIEHINGEKHVYCSKTSFVLAFLYFFNDKNEMINNIYKNIVTCKEDIIPDRDYVLLNYLKSYLKNKIKKLEKMNNIEQIKDFCPEFYKNVSEMIKNEERKNPYAGHRLFIHCRDSFIKNIKKIIIWANTIFEEMSKPIEKELNDYIDKDKFKLYLAGQYVLFLPLIKEPYVTLLYDSIKKLINSIENKDVFITKAHLLTFTEKGLGEEVYIKKLNIIHVNEMLSCYKEHNFIPVANVLENYSKKDFEGKSIDQIKDFVLSEIDKTIKTSTELGSENVDANEMNSKIDELDKKIKSGKLVGKDLLKAKHQLQKLHMVMKEVIPRAIHEGLPPFKGFYVYFYDNGMVAIDKIDYGSRLFVMPVSTYKYILDNKIDRLRKAGRLDSVKAYKHDERTDWLGKAKQAILNSTEYVTEADKKYNEQIDGWNFGYTQEDIDKIKNTIESIEKDVSLTSDEKDKIKKEIEEKAKKKRKKKQKANEIDSELKQSNPKSEEEMTKKDNDELANLESKLDDEFGNDSDFDELYEAEKKYKKNGNRCASVSKFGKDRTIDENGMYHCEMCNTTYSIEQKSRLDYHHFVPISKGGPDTLYNGICLCTECHRIIHYEKERIPISTQGYILSLIEKHIKEENPELLDKFIEYKNNFFPYINDLISDERNRLKKQGLPENMIDIIMEEKEELLLSDPKKYVKGFELRYHK